MWSHFRIVILSSKTAQSSLAAVVALALSACTVHTTPARSNGSAHARASMSASGHASGSDRSTDPAAHQPSPGPAATGSVSSSTIECHGGQSVTLSDRTIQTAGNGVEAHGGCQITLVRCKVIAGRVGIVTHGASSVVVRDSVVEGRAAALELHGKSSVSLANSQIAGRVEKHGLASVADSGGNNWR
jgi:hypothetical protein